MARYRRRAGFSRQVRRKFVEQGTGAAGIGTVGADLLAPFRAQPGATHLGATIMRIRGYVVLKRRLRHRRCRRQYWDEDR